MARPECITMGGRLPRHGFRHRLHLLRRRGRPWDILRGSRRVRLHRGRQLRRVDGLALADVRRFDLGRQLDDGEIRVVLDRAAAKGKPVVVLKVGRSDRSRHAIHSHTGGLAGDIAAIINEEAFDDLDGPIVRITGLDTPVPFSPPLEEFFLPKVGDVVREARKLHAY